ncbi:LacI family DNA-binding transcriptional regulator [Frigoribacterium sp. 2-23]|uniref:LacI family DNA-binding transcriptional regulator n=1 Tax=Frigoribacterium sp. 2-23 TaxID=3415006 RepID=UPI003C6F05B2
MVTARDVATRAGTSTAVVSYVFNNGPRNVSPALRERVLGAAAELDYRPNMLAQALSFGRTASVGLIVPDIANPFFGELARSLQKAALHRDQLLLIGDAGLDPSTEARIISSFVARRVDSAVIVSVLDRPDLTAFERAGIPVVALHPVAADASASSVTIDYEQAAEDAAAHLIEHGYDDIGLLNSPAGSIGGAQHLAGFTRAVARAGRSITTSVRNSTIARGEAAAGAIDWLSGPDRPRAISCATDEQALGVLHAADRLGLRVPDDLAVIGFDGTAQGAYSVPPLTSVKQPLGELAARALDILARAEGSEPVVEQLPHSLVTRASCGRHVGVGAGDERASARIIEGP